MLLLGNLGGNEKFRSFLGAHYPIIGVLMGAFLVAVSTGSYTNWDAQLEYQKNWLVAAALFQKS